MCRHVILPHPAQTFKDNRRTVENRCIRSLIEGKLFRRHARMACATFENVVRSSHHDERGWMPGLRAAEDWDLRSFTNAQNRV